MGLVMCGQVIAPSPAGIAALAGASATFLLVLLAVLDVPFRLHNPLNALAINSLFGFLGQAVFIWVLADDDKRRFLLPGVAPEAMVAGSLALVVAIAAFAVGFTAQPKSHPDRRTASFKRLARLNEWEPQSVIRVSLTLLGLAVASTVYLVSSLGLGLQDLLNEFSAKRRVRVAGAEYGFAALGYARWGMSLSTMSYLLLFSWLLYNPHQRTRKTVSLCGLSLGLSLLAATLTSSRAEFVLALIYSLVLVSFARGGLRIGRVIGVLFVALTISMVLGGFRAVSQNQTDSLSSFSETVSPVEVLVGERRWMSIGKTSVIVDRVPDAYAYRDGGTLAPILAAPIPRTVWQDKPSVRVGPQIGVALFERERDRTGVPPGGFAELYLNFGWTGLAFGAAILGTMIGRADRFLRHAPAGPLTGLLFAIIPIGITYRLPGGDFGGTALSLARYVITFAGFAWIVSRSPRRRARHRGDQLPSSTVPELVPR